MYQTKVDALISWSAPCFSMGRNFLCLCLRGSLVPYKSEEQISCTVHSLSCFLLFQRQMKETTIVAQLWKRQWQIFRLKTSLLAQLWRRQPSIFRMQITLADPLTYMSHLDVSNLKKSLICVHLVFECQRGRGSCKLNPSFNIDQISLKPKSHKKVNVWNVASLQASLAFCKSQIIRKWISCTIIIFIVHNFVFQLYISTYIVLSFRCYTLSVHSLEIGIKVACLLARWGGVSQ